MGKYTDFWKGILNEIKKEFNPVESYNKILGDTRIELLGKRTSGHAGYLELFACQVKKLTNSAVFRNLEEVLRKDSKLRYLFTGHLKIRVTTGNDVFIDYQPFTVEMMMNRYREYQDSTGMKDELYKWVLVKKNHPIYVDYMEGRKSITELINTLDFKNLVDYRTISVWKAIAKVDSEVMDMVFNFFNIRDMNYPRLQQEIDTFREYMIEAHKKLNDPSLPNHAQEERAIATLLTFAHPDQFTFFMNSFYTNLARCMGGEPKKPSKKLMDYYSIVENFIHGPLNDYQDVISIKNRFIRDEKYYDDVDNRLLAQDIFYVTLFKDNYNNKAFDSSLEEERINEDETELLEALNASSEEEIRGYFQVMDVIKESIDLNEFEKISFTCKRKSLNMIVGQRYSWNLLSWKKADRRFGFISSKQIGEDSSLYDGEPRNYYSYYPTANLADANFRSIIKAVRTELSRTSKSSFKEHENALFRKIVFDKNLRAKYIKYLPTEEKEITMHKPVNMILYGPPGTGKTYKLKNSFFTNYEDRETTITQEQNFKEVTKEITWWQAIALDLIEAGGKAKISELKQSRWLKEVAENSSAKDIGASIWATLGSHAIEESKVVKYKRRMAPLIFDKAGKSEWTILMDNVQEQCPEILEIKNRADHFSPKADKLIKRYVFTTFHQAFSYEDFIEGIKPVMDDDVDGEVRYQIESGVFKKLCKQAEKDPDNKYAIFIDEINRGNIANIFGELITLIETNKRTGMDDAISLTLPYSKEVFSVPPNVDIYGTMNTADRSIEALDSALRRRFVFEELMPDPSLINLQFHEISLREVLEVINSRIEVLIDRDHQIGHAYFLKLGSEPSEQEIRSVFADEIIPLLQEYFYNDYVKIGMVLGKGFVLSEGVRTRLFASIENSVASDYSEETIYTIQPDLKKSTFDLHGALVQLLNKVIDDQAS